MSGLICNDCGELGEIITNERGAMVQCYRDGKLCCSTMVHRSVSDAMKSWDRLTAEPVEEWISDFNPTEIRGESGEEKPDGKENQRDAGE